MIGGCLTIEDTDALRHTVRACIERFGDADRVAREVGAADLLDQARSALAVLFEEFGRVALTNNLVDLLVREALDFDLVNGPSFAYPLPQQRISQEFGMTTGGRGTVIQGVLRRADSTAPKQVVLITSTGDAITAQVVEPDTPPCRGFDRDGSWVRVAAKASNDRIDRIRPDRCQRAIAMARLSLGSELLGIASAVQALAIDHVSARRQFGRAIGTFQTVRHRLAETHVSLEAARSVLALAWTHAAAPENGDDLSVYAAAAKAMAGQAFATSIKHANQMCGGMGLTWEHPLPTFVRRGSSLDVLLGTPVDLAAYLGARMASGQLLPTPDPLSSTHGSRC